MNEDTAIINATLSSGKVVPCYVCDCAECGNMFFVPGYSEEWMPSYCPFCGIKFVRQTIEGQPAPYTPKSL
jgi:predicted nucleic acid-binding Zn ribbon protein